MLTAIVVVSCSSTKTMGEQYPAMYEEKPVTIAIMPPINQTTHAEAKDYFYTTMYLPLCEKGYYVFSPYLTWRCSNKKVHMMQKTFWKVTSPYSARYWALMQQCLQLSKIGNVITWWKTNG